VRHLVAVFLAVLAGAAPAAAQMELAVIKGRVVDDSGAPLDGVTIRLVNVDRGREVVLKSGKDGRFYRRGLQAVEYELIVEREGYQPIRDKVKLVAGTDRDFDFTLAKAAAAGSQQFQAGVAAFSSGDFVLAATQFEAAVAQAPTMPALHVNLALAYLRLKRLDDAVTSLERAAALAPTDPPIHYQLGSVYVDVQAYDKAVIALERGLAGKPNLTTDALALEATTTLGAVYFAQGKVNEAEAQFQRVLTARPGAAGAALGMGKILFSKGDVDGALAVFTKVVADHPGTAEAMQAAAFIKELRKSPLEGGIL
jgi:tetratricopeptide (TPR) repeat protein